MSTERSDQEQERPGRRSPMAVASVAAAVLIVGGGGAYLVTAAASGGTTDGGQQAEAGAGGTPPPLELDGHTQGVAPGEPDPGGGVYRARVKLPEGPGEAAVHQFEAGPRAADVAKLAKALGVPGEPRAEGGTWLVGTAGDGQGPLLRVNKRAPGTWSFQGHTPPGGDDCPKGKVCAGPGGTEDGDPVGEKAARSAAAPVLKALGQDDAKLDAGQVSGGVRVVNAQPVVDGLPTYGWSTGVRVAPDGSVVGGSGQLSEPVKGDTYPVLTAEQTLAQLNGASKGDGRVGIGGCAGPAPLGEEAADGSAPPKDPCTPGGEQPERKPVEVRGAVLGLSAQFVSGRQALVPSWLFEARPEGHDRSFTVTRPAVDPEYLAPAPKPEKPGTDPGRSPDGERKLTEAESYRVDGRELTVRFWGGVCEKYTAAAEEKDGSVTVRITGEPQEPGKVCVKIAKQLTAKVTLDEPLGDREVVGEDGSAVPRD
ncbi:MULTISPECIES: hypothetical protein [Streptomyces]|uniref:Membrane protein n=3 Tax=Streptomyces TaxID=1883 RepID=A0A8H9LHA8_9ACTN|nr:MULTISPECIES: hypothetical protein [Streptomyces]NEE31247.1 hypothetical protein [Streptomyces sp. SID7982]NEE61641.1 hypothetical protein [Streptomyces sp. SID8455]MBL3807139.1 hypothetical protein [Streptomyces sp. BRB081]MDQ0295945.1 hypothetical protein [Streptomyces sp. DSM 41037]PJM85332.1 hypothetical protein CH313_05295 [Streptomyces sp. TSRI0384-2]